MDYGEVFWDRRVLPVEPSVADSAAIAGGRGVVTKIARVGPVVQARRSQDEFVSLATVADYLGLGDLQSLWKMRTVSRGCRQAASERICVLLGLSTTVPGLLSEVQGLTWEMREVLVRFSMFQRFVRLNMRHLSGASMSLRTEWDRPPGNLKKPDQEELASRARKTLPAIPVSAIEEAVRGCAVFGGAATVAVRTAGGWPWIQAVRHYEDAAVVLAAVGQDGMALQVNPQP